MLKKTGEITIISRTALVYDVDGNIPSSGATSFAGIGFKHSRSDINVFVTTSKTNPQGKYMELNICLKFIIVKLTFVSW